jgi:hypothetical protein
VAQILHEAWRINRDYFYDPGMHGADWRAMEKKYARFLPDLAVRQDLNRVIRWMCQRAGGRPSQRRRRRHARGPDTIPAGLLGADYESRERRYRFKKVFGGLELETRAARAADRAGRRRAARASTCSPSRARAARARGPLRALREQRRPHRRDHGRPERRRQRLAHA